MRYYDALEDSHCKGFIDLAEVVSVALTSWTQGAPKRADEKGFFDVSSIQVSEKEEIVKFHFYNAKLLTLKTPFIFY